MSQVAQRAGVSQSTVSLVLAGQSAQLRISDKTRERVQQAVSSLGYQRNQFARAMITGKSRILGLLVTPWPNENTSRMLTGAVEGAGSEDYMVKVINLTVDSEVDDTVIARCTDWQIAGAMALGLTLDASIRMSSDMQSKALPFAVIDSAPNVEWGIRVRSDDDSGIRASVAHLLERKHTKIAYIGGKEGHFNTLRELAFRSAVDEASLHLPEHWLVATSWSDRKTILDGVRRLFGDSGTMLPTGIVCASDAIAMTVVGVARSHGLRVPEDLSIIGYSNTTLSEFADPPLTTVDQSFFQMGYEAAVRVCRLIDDFSMDSKMQSNMDELVPTRLILRESTALAPDR